MLQTDLSEYKEEKPKYVKLLVWKFINATIFRLAIGNKLYFIRTIILKIFGAKIPLRAMIYPSCTIYAPWNLEVGIHTCIGPKTKIYNKGKLIIGENSVISQGSYVCCATHDTTNLLLPLIKTQITIGKNVWIAADAFVGPNITIGEGAVVGARSAVFKNVEPWTVVGGNPAKFIKKRIINE